MISETESAAGERTLKALPRLSSTTSLHNVFDDEDNGDGYSTINPQCDARTKTTPTEIQLAYARIKTFLPQTPLFKANKSLCPGFTKLYIKAEQKQFTSSFKERGALNALLLTTPEERKKGVITASAGNHSQALSYHAKKLKIPVTVYMPTIAPLSKIQKCIEFGAEVIIHGENLNVAREAAMKEAGDKGLLYIHGFNDCAIVNGAGSCGIEILEQLPDCEAIIVAAGGGGFIAGVAMAAKQRNPNVKIICVETEACPSMIEAHKAGRPVKVATAPTLADGTAVPLVGEHAFRIADPLIDEYVVVPESQICLALLRVLEVEHVVLEGSGALGIAAMLNGQLDHLKNKKTCVIFTGGNIDMTVLGRVIERGLFVDNRLMRLRANISDNPGALAEFLTVVADVGASVKDIQQERGYIQSRAVWVRISVETRGKDHADELLDVLRKEKGYHIEVELDHEVDHYIPPQPVYRAGKSKAASSTPPSTTPITTTITTTGGK